MAELQSLSNLKIESVLMVAEYLTRTNFSECTQLLIDSIHEDLADVLREEEDKSGSIEVKIDSDEDIVFTYESGSFHFQMDIRRNISAVQFKNLYEHDLALRLAKAFFSKVVDVLRLKAVNGFAFEFTNILVLGDDVEDTNCQLFENRLMPQFRICLAPLVAENARVRRSDFKTIWERDDQHICTLLVECPGDRNNSVVSTKLKVATRDGIKVEVNEELVGREVDTGFDTYFGDYAEVIVRLLNGVDIDFGAKRLERP